MEHVDCRVRRVPARWARVVRTRPRAARRRDADGSSPARRARALPAGRRGRRRRRCGHRRAPGSLRRMVAARRRPARRSATSRRARHVLLGHRRARGRAADDVRARRRRCAVEASRRSGSTSTMRGRPAPLEDWFLDLYGTAANGRQRERTPAPRRRRRRRVPSAMADCDVTDFDVLGHVNNAVVVGGGRGRARRATRTPDGRLAAAEIEYRAPIDLGDVVRAAHASSTVTAWRAGSWSTTRCARPCAPCRRLGLGLGSGPWNRSNSGAFAGRRLPRHWRSGLHRLEPRACARTRRRTGDGRRRRASPPRREPAQPRPGPDDVGGAISEPITVVVPTSATGGARGGRRSADFVFNLAGQVSHARLDGRPALRPRREHAQPGRAARGPPARQPGRHRRVHLDPAALRQAPVPAGRRGASGRAGRRQRHHEARGGAVPPLVRRDLRAAIAGRAPDERVRAAPAPARRLPGLPPDLRAARVARGDDQGVR